MPITADWSGLIFPFKTSLLFSCHIRGKTCFCKHVSTVKWSFWNRSKCRCACQWHLELMLLCVCCCMHHLLARSASGSCVYTGTLCSCKRGQINHFHCAQFNVVFLNMLLILFETFQGRISMSIQLNYWIVLVNAALDYDYIWWQKSQKENFFPLKVKNITISFLMSISFFGPASYKNTTNHVPEVAAVKPCPTS